MSERDLIKEMPGFEVHWACKRLLTSYSILLNNSTNLLEYCQTPQDLSFQFLPNTESRLKKNKIDNEVLRLVHNFLASVKTLVDISRNYGNKYLSVEDLETYKSKIEQEVLNSEVAKLVIDLRNYILHRDMPTIGHGIDPITGISNSVFLHTPKLLLWNKWNSLSKKIISEFHSKGQRIVINEIVNQYMSIAESIAESITQSLFDLIVKSNREQLENVYEQIDALNLRVKKENLIADPLIVDFYTRKNEYSCPFIKKSG